MSANGGGLTAALELIDGEIAEREEDLGKLRAAREYIVSLLSGQVPIHNLGSAPALLNSNNKTSARINRAEKLDGDDVGILDAAAIVLAMNAHPMGADQIARAMMAGGYRYDKPVGILRRTIRGVVGRDIRMNANSPFAKPARGKFALRKWFSKDELEMFATLAGADDGPDDELED